MAENRYHEGILGESVARFHLHFGERENENVNGEFNLKAKKRESTYVPRDKRALERETLLIKILLKSF